MITIDHINRQQLEAVILLKEQSLKREMNKTGLNPLVRDILQKDIDTFAKARSTIKETK